MNTQYNGTSAGMPRRIFRKFAFKRHQIGESAVLAPFRNLMHEPRYWGIRRRTVVPAFALGLFSAWLPWPGHPIMAALLALAFRINIPVAAVTTFVSNPLTMAPMYYFAYQLGVRLLDVPPQPFDFEMSIAWVTHTFVKIWQPMTVGCLLLGTLSALVGFVVVDVLWRFSLHDYKLRKRNERETRNSG